MLIKQQCHMSNQVYFAPNRIKVEFLSKDSGQAASKCCLFFNACQFITLNFGPSAQTNSIYSIDFISRQRWTHCMFTKIKTNTDCNVNAQCTQCYCDNIRGQDNKQFDIINI